MNNEEVKIKFSRKEACCFGKWMDARINNTPLGMGQYIAEYYKNLRINLDDEKENDQRTKSDCTR